MIAAKDAQGAQNTCVMAALHALTGVPAEAWLERVRAIDPHSCRRGYGTRYGVYTRVLREAGFEVENHHISKPLHLALAELHGAKALVVIDTGRRSRHAIAAHGFIVCDNAVSTPQWYADWQEARKRMWRPWWGSPITRIRPYRVTRLTIVRGELRA